MEGPAMFRDKSQGQESQLPDTCESICFLLEKSTQEQTEPKTDPERQRREAEV